MADRISWIKNLLSHGTTAEQQMVREAAEHGRKTGHEMMLVGEQGQPKILPDFLRSYGTKTAVNVPGGYDQFMLEAGKQGIPVSTAHPHPTNIALPSMGDYHVWANANNFYDNASNNLGRGTFLPDLARANMWIAGPKGPNDVTHIPAMPNRGAATDYDLVRRIKELGAKNDMNLSSTGSHGYNVSRKFDDYIGSWGLSLPQRAELYGSIADVPLYNRLAGLSPLHMDPQTQLVRGRPDILAGDVFPEWMKLLDKSNLDPTKAEGGQVEDTPFPLAYASQYFDKGGPVLGVTGLEAMRQYAKALKDIFKRPITVAAPNEAWEKIVKDNRFKSQFETGTSEGSYEPGFRARTEQELFGLHPEDTPTNLRPIYGHVTDLSNIDNSRSYGQWGAVLDPSVNKRSTFHLDDSLGAEPSVRGPFPFSEGWHGNEQFLRNWMKHTLGERRGIDMREELPETRWGPRGFKSDEPKTAGMLPTVAGFPYIEAQVHGGLPFDDVRAMVRKIKLFDPDMAAADAQKMADITGRPSFAPWDKTDFGGLPPNWMLAHPGESVNKVLDVPAASLRRYGYAEGGQHDDVMPPFPLAYASQYFDDGGQMKGPVMATTGPQIMRKGLDNAMRAVIEHFGGLKSPTLPYGGTGSNIPRVHPEIPPWATKFANTTWKPSVRMAESTDYQWLAEMRAAGIDVEKTLAYEHPIREAINQYTGSEYDSMSGYLRRFANNPDKTVAGGHEGEHAYAPDLEWWRKGEGGHKVAELAKYLQDQEYELPFDLYRGTRIRHVDDIENLHPEHGAPQVRGTGIGSFTYNPENAYAFGQDVLHKKKPPEMMYDEYDRQQNFMRVPSVVRIPQGSKVRGMNVPQYSGLAQESEFLAAPFQGFDVTGTNLISPNPGVHNGAPRLLLNAEPSGIYDPRTPIIYGEGGQVDEPMPPFPLAYGSQYFDEGGQVPGYQQGGFDDDESLRHSIPYGSFGLPQSSTPTFKLPIGKGEATVGGGYDMINKILDAQLGYEYPVGKSGARLGVQGNFNKYIGEGGNEVKPNWGARIGLTLPFAEGGEFDPYEDIIEAQRLMGAYR